MGTTKRLFIGLLSICTLLLGGLAWFLLYALLHYDLPAYQWVLLTIGGVGAAFILLFGMGILALVLSILRDRPMGRLGRLLFQGTLRLYPFALGIGRLLKIPTEKIQGSFVEVNNKLVRSCQFAVPPEKIVVLAPHCLQRTECTAKVTQDAFACTGCGACDIAGLAALCRRLGVHLVVVTGGTLARKKVKEIRPEAVVAVACERDLSSGILDVLPVPALGVGNTRPEGPCKNTRVDCAQVEEAIRFFLQAPAENALSENSENNACESVDDHCEVESDSI